MTFTDISRNTYMYVHSLYLLIGNLAKHRLSRLLHQKQTTITDKGDYNRRTQQ